MQPSIRLDRFRWGKHMDSSSQVYSFSELIFLGGCFPNNKHIALASLIAMSAIVRAPLAQRVSAMENAVVQTHETFQTYLA